MSDPTLSSWVSLDGLTKPATELVKRICDGVEGFARPRQIKRIASAEAQAAKIAAEARIEIDELQRRALIRRIKADTRHQRNIEEITAKALPDVKEDAKPEDIHTDWLDNFFERSKTVSCDQMQSLWARVLAGEANSPGTFTRRTVEALSSLHQKNAEWFTRLCSFYCNFTIWEFKSLPVIPRGSDKLVNQIHESHTNYTQPLVGEFSSTCHPYYPWFIFRMHLYDLQDAGLIVFSETPNLISLVPSKSVICTYFQKSIELSIKPPITDTFTPVLNLGHVKLTSVGRQLRTICGATRLPDFEHQVIDYWRTEGGTPISKWSRALFKKTRSEWGEFFPS